MIDKKKNGIVFLDLDGPMIPYEGKISGCGDSFRHAIPFRDFPYYSRFCPYAMQMLGLLCRQYDLEIVTNSSHNGQPNYSKDDKGTDHIHRLFEMNKFHQYLRKEDFKTQYAQGKYMGGWGKLMIVDYVSRANAVDKWLNEHLEITRWVVFDDDRVDFEKEDAPERVKSCFVLTKGDGISPENIREAKKILKQFKYQQEKKEEKTNDAESTSET